GNTSLAISVTVSIFLSGLAIGSFLSARSVRIRFPFRVYAALEAFIGVYSLITPRLAGWIETLYAASYSALAGRFLLSVSLKAILAAGFLLVPTIAMGATLPILVRLFDPPDRQKHAGMLYGLNTAGAVAGTLLSGYWMIPVLGVSLTIRVAAGLNLLIALTAWALSKRQPITSEISPTKPGGFRSVYWLFLLTGFSLLCYEILWTRALTMFFGSSVYAFSAILASFLLGIALGSSYYAKRVQKHTDPYQLFSLIQFRLALSAIFFLAIFMGLPYLLIRIFQAFYHSFALYQTAQLLLIACTIVYTTFLAGAAFPASLQFFRHEPELAERHAGYVYGYNTIGSILGSLCAGFVLIPLLGVEHSIRIVVLINLLLGMYCFRKTASGQQNKRVLMIGAVALALLIFLPPWNRSIYNAGFYAFAYKYVPQPNAVKPAPPRSQWGRERPLDQATLLPSYRSADSLNLLYYSEGLTATVAVSENENGIRSLLINGKPDASNVPTGDMRTQLMLGHLPALLAGPPKTALIIGLGSGVTAGALATHHPAQIDCVEIERKVADAARYYEAENNGILQNKIFQLVFDDGRNVVQHTAERYDVITSEPSNLWMSGVANLFTLEFFTAARSRLNPGGVLCQWIHLYQISKRDILIFLKTFHLVFPYLSVWINDSDMLVLGSDHPLQIDPGMIQRRLTAPDVERNVVRSNISVGSLLRNYVGNERMVKVLDKRLPINTDDHPVLEFSAPHSLFENRARQITRDLIWLQQYAERLSAVADQPAPSQVVTP
ncbi:MAG TPA: fused MFS/spermidine synthase, partial [Acidobacteriota bacterium]|nr:fused MFS/spermidine synthase [Acidobacteriota bacterium]